MNELVLRPPAASAELADYIVVRQPQSASLRTCLGVAYTMNRLKYAELLYRLRILERAEQESEGTQKPTWTKPLLGAALWSAAVAVILCLCVAARLVA